jgi:hypothetical protein
VLRALAQDPAARYQTAEQLVIELEELAREHKLKQSPSALSAMLGQLFAPELGAWRDARDAGVALADHLHEAGDLTTPVSESAFIELDASVEDDDDLVPELDDDDEDDEKTEHMPVLIDPMAPAVEPPGTDPAVTALLASAGAATATLVAAEPTEPPATESTEMPTAPLVAAEPATLAGPPFAPMAAPAVRPATPSAPLPQSRPPAPGAPGAPFGVPPWRSGQPPSSGTGPSERIARSWAIVELPAIDPAMFARQRSIALRITAGLVTFVVLLAILAGRC